MTWVKITVGPALLAALLLVIFLPSQEAYACKSAHVATGFDGRMMLVRDGDKSLAGKDRTSSRKEREAELDRQYQEMQAAGDAWRATLPEGEEVGGDEGLYVDYTVKNQEFYQDLGEARTNKEVHKDYAPWN
jgi:hypothetical protein